MTINIEDLTLKQIKEINSLSESKQKEDIWEIGKKYFIRTVTMHTTGKLKKLTPKEMLLEKAAWIADSGRFSDALRTGSLDEVEPFLNDLIVNRESIIDATEWTHDLPEEKK
jgi:hypothetical protein